MATRPLDMIDDRNGSRRPVPDPTVLTTQQLIREIAAVREIIEARLVGIDGQLERLEEHLDDQQCLTRAEVAHLQKLHDEKFKSISVQFAERDTRTEQTSKDNKVAIDAALQAQKEAVGKSEVSFTKQIDQLEGGIKTLKEGLDDKIDDVRTRITTVESRAKGIGDSWGWFVGGIGLLAGVVPVIMLLMR